VDLNNLSSGKKPFFYQRKKEKSMDSNEGEYNFSKSIITHRTRVYQNAKEKPDIECCMEEAH